ncbi:hypothetical protein HPP92_021070 [Vanilla planifolia]|uniref:DUF7950 domain-containing protein n=1 Tax=Vanilla planifolia TaxID=51239 RepID=A0A835PVG6_VANPL|nr:hypothetical protein HPP92_021372 [Vanilla planifolia]KAG0462594.1 hypothetical protein HPP92_021070 [Vanilla planifolia]
MEMGVDADVALKMGRILLKYRPIAPKPPAVGAAAVEQVPERKVLKRRGKEGRRRGGRKARKVSKEKEDLSPVVTLPLMPETPERKEGTAFAVVSPTCSDELPLTVPTATYFCTGWERKDRAGVVAPRAVRVVGTLVTVESLSGTWEAGMFAGVGEEVRRRVEEDESPAFVSDAEGRVTWTNAAYRKMVVGGGDSLASSPSSLSSFSSAEEVVVRVALVTRRLVPEVDPCGGFSCMVSLRYVCRRNGQVSMVVPCDVWRMEGGCFVWLMDVLAALGLGIGA